MPDNRDEAMQLRIHRVHCTGQQLLEAGPPTGSGSQRVTMKVITSSRKPRKAKAKQPYDFIDACGKQQEAIDAQVFERCSSCAELVILSDHKCPNGE